MFNLLLNGYLPKFQNVQPCVEWAVRALAVVNLDMSLLGVAVQGAAVNAEKFAGSCDCVPSSWLDVRFGLCHRSPPSFSSSSKAFIMLLLIAIMTVKQKATNHSPRMMAAAVWVMPKMSVPIAPIHMMALSAFLIVLPPALVRCFYSIRLRWCSILRPPK